MKVTFDHQVDEAVNISTFYFKTEKPVRYTAGQFVELTLNHENPDERGIKRKFTLSSSPTEPLLSITTKFTEQGGSSFKTALRALTPGTEVSISDPMGDFVLPKLIQTPLIFIAGGIGITPFRSIFSWLADTAEPRPIHFFYAVRNEEEIVFQPILDRAGVQTTIVVSQPTAAWGGVSGQLTAELILGLEKPTDDTLFYIAGPGQMVESLSKDLQSSGIQQSQLVSDSFHKYDAI